MISDILSDAISEIEKWQSDELYTELKPQIAYVVHAMDDLRQALDTPPGKEHDLNVALLPIIDKTEYLGLQWTREEIVGFVESQLDDSEWDFLCRKCDEALEPINDIVSGWATERLRLLREDLRQSTPYEVFERQFKPGEPMEAKEIPCDTDPHRVWTVVDAEGESIIINGLHFVNRLACILTENPWEDGRQYEFEFVVK